MERVYEIREGSLIALEERVELFDYQEIKPEAEDELEGEDIDNENVACVFGTDAGAFST